MTSRIHEAMEKAVAENVFPGAALLVSVGGEVVIRDFFGNATLLPQPEPVTEKTVFDVASLTKPVATSSILMLATSEKQISLNTPVSEFVPEFDAEEKKKIKIHHLLKHTSGLPAWRPYFQEIAREHPESVGRREARRYYVEKISQESLELPISYQRIYSDIGFILLGVLIENRCEATLDHLFQEKIAGPLGMKNSFYLPVGEARPDLPFAATEESAWRKKLICGEVHDDNAYALGGVAGHAGLFSTVDDLHRFLLEVRNGSRGEATHFSRESVLEFAGSRAKWKLGWDTPSEGDSQAGRWFSRNSVGHLGYTGCSFWIDFDQDFHVILLSNRVHPTSRNEAIKEFRPMIHDLIFEEIVKDLKLKK